MNGTELRLPRDADRWPEYRSLAAQLSPMAASHILFRLWIELGHLASINQAPGVMVDSDLILLQGELPGTDWPAVRAALTNEHLGLLQLQDDGTYQCRRFAALHPHLAPGYKSMASRGAEASLFVRRQKRDSRLGLDQALLLPVELFELDGKPLNSEMVRRVQWLVRSIDNALGRKPRGADEWSAGLISDAVRVLSGSTDAVLQTACRRVLVKRDHPAMPKTAEQLLPRWAEVEELLR